MNAYFDIFEPFPGVFHIGEPLGVCSTLLVGAERALLLDTGYGLGDLAACVREITPLPVTVVLSHGHHDHALGACQFSEVYLHPADFDLYEESVTRERRRGILERASKAGMLPEPCDIEHYTARHYARPLPLNVGSFDLGGMTAEVVEQPGHTQGSVALLVKERALLLLGDNWNPQTWLFFPFSVPVMRYRDTLRAALPLPFEYALVSHDRQPRPRAQFENYLAGITKERLESAERLPTSAYWQGADTCACFPEPESKLVFDRNKID